MGVGDLSVGKKIYHMTEAFSGRLMAYRKFNNEKYFHKIKTSIRKNIYGTLKEINNTHLDNMKLYIINSMDAITRNKVDIVSENSSIFLDLNRYIINKQKGI
jgi:hypothetical protein